MNLIIDIGNTNTKYFWQENTYYNFADLEKELNKTEAKGFSVNLISTVSSKTSEMKEKLLNSRFSDKLGEISNFDAQGQSSIKNIYKGIGADRVAKLTGAMKLFPNKDILVFDFGTATTITALNSKGEFQGGCIGVGFISSFKTLASQASALPDLEKELYQRFTEEIEKVKSNINSGEADFNSTSLNILNGIYLSHLGLIEKWKEVFKKKLPNAMFISTGGASKFFKEEFDYLVTDRELLQSAFN